MIMSYLTIVLAVFNDILNFELSCVSMSSLIYRSVDYLHSLKLHEINPIQKYLYLLDQLYIVQTNFPLIVSIFCYGQQNCNYTEEYRITRNFRRLSFTTKKQLVGTVNSVRFMQF